MEKYAFGVDVGGTTVKMAFFELTGKMLEKWEIPTNTSNGGAMILEDIAHAIEHKLTERGVSKDEVSGIGIGVPGPVVGGNTVVKCVNLGWGEVNVAKVLGNKTELPVRVGNDANVAALGEMWQGGGKGCSNVVVVTLGTGVGGGIIVDGRMVAGAHGAGGEIGHIMVDETETETCGCGKKGCLEQYTSATGVVRLAKRALAAEETDSTLRSLNEITAKDVFDEAKAGDQMALAIVEKMGKILGTALANIATIADPEVFVIGGGVSKAGSILIETIQKYYKQNAFHACQNAKFELAKLGNDAGTYGCVYMLIND